MHKIKLTLAKRAQTDVFAQLNCEITKSLMVNASGCKIDNNAYCPVQNFALKF